MHELPEPLRRRTLRYFEAQWNLENGVDVRTVFNELPEFLKADIKLQMHADMVSWNAITGHEACPDHCLTARQLRVPTASHGDFLGTTCS
jgi:hypothetical protein